MWSREEEVTCVACGTTLPREDAREYDKHGDRWEREGKTFEYLCKPCFRGLSKADRGGLEAALVAAGAGERSRDAFLARFLDAADADAERGGREGRYD